MIYVRFTALAASLVLTSSAVAQESTAVDFQAMVETSVKKLHQGQVYLQGKISQEKKESGFGAGVVIVGGGAESGEAFLGDFEGYFLQDGNKVFVSQSRLPGFAIWLGERRIVQTRYEDQPVDLSSMLLEFDGLFDAKRFLKYARKAEWTGEQDASGAWTLEAQLADRVIPTGGGIASSMGFGAKVMRVEARLGIHPEGYLTECRFKVVRSDPMAAIHKQMEEGDLTSGEMEISFDPTESKDEELEEGDAQILTFKFKKQEASKALKEEIAQFRRILAAEEVF